MHTLKLLLEIYAKSEEDELCYIKSTKSLMVKRLKNLNLIEVNPTATGFLRITQEGINFLEEIEARLKIK